MPITTQTKYLASDGKEFLSYAQAEEYEESLRTKGEKLYEQYLTTWSGIELLKNYKLTEEGTWDIYGEDENCDLGGFHHTPFLDRVHGTLEKTIKYAVNLPSFWTWGGGGHISPAKIRGVRVL